MQQYLFHNNGDGTFKECALESGVGLTSDGKGLSGMGTAFQDYDNDGRPDIITTVLPRELYALFHNDGDGSFTYDSLKSGLGALTSGSSGWGVGLEDFDNDGWKDLFVAQSHVLENVEKIDASLRYKELPLLALNHNGRFERTDSGVTTPLAARGAAFGDINNDGRMDAIITTLGGPPVLLLNRCDNHNHWLSITLRGTRSNRDGYGAKVSVNGQTRFATSAGSYVCANDKRLHFGLGSAEKAQRGSSLAFWHQASFKRRSNRSIPGSSRTGARMIFFFLLALATQAATPDAMQHVQAGLEARKQHQVDVEITEFREAAKIDPDLAEAFLNLGAAYMEKHDYGAAIIPLKRALRT